MSKNSEINVHNRYTNKKEIEKIYGDGFVRFAYDSLLGKMLGKIISSRALSRLYLIISATIQVLDEMTSEKFLIYS